MSEVTFKTAPDIQKVQYGEYEYLVNFNEFKVLFNDASVDATHLMAIEKDNTLLKFRLPDVAPKETLVTENTIFYPSIYADVDLSYEIQENKIKETIIINNAFARHTFTYSTEENNIAATVQEDGTIIYTDINNEELYRIDAPYAFDANNNTVEVTTTNAAGGYIVEVKPNASTVYPIYVDPTVTLSTTSTYAFMMVSSAITGASDVAIKEIDLNKFDITSLTVAYQSNTAYYCKYTFIAVDANNVETTLGLLSQESSLTINIPAGSKKLRIEGRWNTYSTTMTVYHGFKLKSLTTNTKGFVYGKNSYSQNFTTLTTYGTIDNSVVTNVYPIGIIGSASSILPYYMNSTTGKFILRYTDDSSVVHNVYLTDYSSGLLSESIPVSKLSGCNCYIYINSNSSYGTSTNTTEAIFFNNADITPSTVNVNLTFDALRSISKANTTTYDSKRNIATTNSITADSKIPVCVAVNLSLDTIRTTVQDIVLISDTEKMIQTNISSIVDLKRMVGISQSISIDTLRLATIYQNFSSDTYRTIKKSTSLTLDVSRRTTCNLSFSLDTVRKSAVSDNISLDINRKISKTTALTLDSLRKTYVGSIWVERIAQKYQDGTLYTSVKTKNLIPNVIPLSEYALDGYGLFGLDLVIGFRDPATNTFWSPYPSEYNLPVTVVVNGVQKSFTAVYTSKYITVNSYNVNLYTLKITSDVPITSFGYVVPNGSAHLTGDSVIYSSKNANSNTYLKYYYKYGTYINTRLTLDAKRAITKTNYLNLDTAKNTIVSKSSTLDLKRSVGVQDNILIDSQKNIVKSLESNVDTIKTVIKTYDVLLDTNRTTQSNISTVFDSIRNIANQNVFSSDTIRTTLATDYLTLDSQRQMVASESNVFDTKRKTAAQNNIYLDTLRSTLSNVTLSIDTKRAINTDNASDIFLDTKKIIINNTSSSMDTYRQIAAVNQTTYDSQRVITIADDLILDTSKQVTTQHVEHLAIDTKRLVVTNSSNNLDIKKVPTVTSDIEMDTLRGTSVTSSMTLDTIKTAQANTILNVDMIKEIQKDNAFNLDSTRQIVLPTTENLDSSRTIDITEELLLDTNKQVTFSQAATINIDTNRQIAVKENIALDNNRVIGIQDNQTLDIIRTTQENITSSFDTIRNRMINNSTEYETKRLIASESKIYLDIFREIVNRQTVNISTDTIRVIQKDVVAKEDLLRSVIVTFSSNVDMFRQITLTELIDLDVIRDVERSIVLKADTSKKVNKAEAVNYDLKRKFAANLNLTLDTLKVIGLNSIYLLNTKRIVRAKPVFKVDTKRQVIKDIDEYKDMIRELTVNDLIIADTSRILINRQVIRLDAERMISKDINITLDTKRVIFMSSSNLYPTLDVSLILDDGELKELSRSYNNSLEFNCNQYASSIEVVIVEGSEITIDIN